MEQTLLDAIDYNLTAPIPLFLALGVLLALIHPELNVPEALYIGVTLYLLVAIGLHGGAEIRAVGIHSIWMPLVTCVLLGTLIPIAGSCILWYSGKFSIHDAAAIGGHYGSVGAVTFAVALQFLPSLQVRPESYMSAFLTVLEPAGVIVGILLARIALRFETRRHADVNAASETRVGWIRPVFYEALTGKWVMILLGALVIGYISGVEKIAVPKPFSTDLFKGVLFLFILEMSLVAGQRRVELRGLAWFPSRAASLCPSSMGQGASSWATSSGSTVAAPHDIGCDDTHCLLHCRTDGHSYLNSGSGLFPLVYGVIGDHVFIQHRHGHFTLLLAGNHYLLILAVWIKDERKG